MDSKFSKRTPLILNVKEYETVRTISNKWFNITSLKNEYRFSENFVATIRELANEYAGWKRVRGDGNCYYRAVISTFIEKLFHFNQDVKLIYYYVCLIDQFEPKYNNYFQQEVAYVKEFLRYLYEKIYNDPSYKSRVSVFKEVLEYLQNERFDDCLIKYSRVASLCALRSSKNLELFSHLPPEDLGEALEYGIMSMGREAEDIELILLPLALHISVCQKNIFNDKIATTKYPSENDFRNGKIIIDIINKSRGHYDVLYKIQDLENEDFNMTDGVYMVLDQE